MVKMILLATLITLLGCGISISPVPGVSIYIPIPHEDHKKDHDEAEKKNDTEQPQ